MGLLARLRRVAGSGFWGSLLDCFYCLSLWSAAPFALVLGESLGERFLQWLAFSAGAVLVERVTSRQAAAPPASYFEEENGNAMLREEKSQRPVNYSDSPSA